MALQKETAQYRDGDESLTGFFCFDDAVADRRPSVLVIHGGRGLDGHAKTQAERFAKEGHLAFACDMFGASVTGDKKRIVEHLMAVRSDRERLTRRARAGLARLREHPRFDGRTVVVGYCFGGLTALELARAGTAVDAAISVHGSLETAKRAEPGAIRAKLLVCHGALDPHVPVPHVAGFIEEMNHAGADWRLIAYGGAMHGFTHEADKPGVKPGVAYHAPTDARSWQDILTFLRES